VPYQAKFSEAPLRFAIPNLVGTPLRHPPLNLAVRRTQAQKEGSREVSYIFEKSALFDLKHKFDVFCS
jgi:hypothetical protein